MTSLSQKLFTEGAGLVQSKGVSKGGSLAARKVAIGVAGLLLEASGRDGDYAPEEIEIIKLALQKQLQVAPEQVPSILQEADQLRKNRSNLETAARSLREAFSTDQLIVVLAMVWQVVVADGKVGAPERQFADGIRSRLALSAEQSKESEKIAKSANRKKD